MVRRPNLPTKIDNLLWIAMFASVVMTALVSASAGEECRLKGDCAGEEEVACSFDILYRAALPIHLDLDPQADSTGRHDLHVVAIEFASVASTERKSLAATTDILAVAPKTSPPFVAVSLA